MQILSCFLFVCNYPHLSLIVSSFARGIQVYQMLLQKSHKLCKFLMIIRGRIRRGGGKPFHCQLESVSRLPAVAAMWQSTSAHHFGPQLKHKSHSYVMQAACPSVYLLCARVGVFCERLWHLCTAGTPADMPPPHFSGPPSSVNCGYRRNRNCCLLLWAAQRGKYKQTNNATNVECKQRERNVPQHNLWAFVRLKYSLTFCLAHQITRNLCTCETLELKINDFCVQLASNVQLVAF